MYGITPDGVFLNQIIFYLINRTMSRLGNYLRDTTAEMKHVTWPTPIQAMTYTVLVIVVSAVVALYLGAADFLFTRLLNIVIGA
jgi:preprotein translocase subunit SecE